MFRVTQFMQELVHPTPVRPKRNPPGPVVIWNLVRRCNLTCKHCYSISADKDFPGELSTRDVFRVMDDLQVARVPVLILSGGEPLLRPDIFDIGRRAKAMGFYVGLSSNGTLVNAENVEAIAATGFDYVGISLDGIRATHDRFRRKQGAFDAALNGVRLCREAGAKVGIRFTLAQENAHDFPALLDLMEAEGIDKFYLSHLNYAPWTCCWTAAGDTCRRAGRRNSSPATTTPTASTCCTGWRPASRNSTSTSGRNSCNGAATPAASTSPTSTTWVTSIQTPCGGTTPWATCASVPSARSGQTPPIP